MLRAIVLLLAVAGCSLTALAQDAIPKVREERPRLVLRAKAWDGPSVERTKGWLSRPEYQENLKALKSDGVSGAYRYQVLGDEEAGKKCVAWLKGLKVPEKSPGDSPSYTGEALLYDAMVYDWMRDHPDFAKEEDRKAAVAYLEWWGELFKKHNSPGVVPFYSRNAGASLGLAAIAIALHGDSPKADGFLAHAYKDFTENIGTIRQMEDGATGGSSYGIIHEFQACANATAAWRAGTDWDAAKWIKDKQGNWLERQMLYQIWAVYPNHWYWKEGDTWSAKDSNEHTLSLLVISDMYKNGFGRANLDSIHKRWTFRNAYYGWRIFWWFLYNNPDVASKPLDGLGKADVFSPKLHGYVCWRDSWADDATVIHFKTGDNVDHHGTWDTGKFTIFKYSGLAIKNGWYAQPYKSSKHLYYKSCWSANVVIFDGPKSHGWQKGMDDLDGYASWPTWKAKRDTLWPVAGVLKTHEANDKFARAVADLSGSTWPDNSTWIRELVFLGYKYLLVLDRVKPGAGVNTRWILHSVDEPKIDGDKRLVTIDNGKGRLFCQTLLPDGAKIEKVGAPGKSFFHKNLKGVETSWDFNGKKGEDMLGVGRFDVVPADPSAECVYLHVLFPTDTGTAAMPACSVEKKGADLVVKVGELTYTFAQPQAK
ncbi:MAG: heparinase II/III family protein [Phycisphaerae bacterium]|nr:heparinase II/III family protein [Phycisphaerae bacterium]